MEKPLVITVFILMAALVAIVVYYYRPKTIILRRLKKLPLQRVGSLRTNTYSKIEGKALNIEAPLITPLSKRKCVFYKIKIQKKVSSGKSSHWKTVVDEEQIQDFFIEQNSERVVVLTKKSPKNYYDYLVTDRKVSSGTFNDPTPEFKALLESYNIETKGLFGFNKQLRYEEAIIEVGERITVAGFVKWMDLENRIADYSYSKIASVSANGKNKILITDSPAALRPKRQKL